MDVPSQIKSALQASSFPPPSQNLLSSLSPSIPLPSLLATAKSRILSSDLTSSPLINPSLPTLPAGIDSPAAKEVVLGRDTHVQVVDIENLSVSRWEQVEELEAIERGERTRGREVIQVTGEENENVGTQSQPATQAQPTQAGKNAIHRLTLQDRAGNKVYAIELRRIDKIGIGKTMMGEKILLKRGTVVARGTVLLTADKCVFLGGKIDAWQRTWVEGRLARLKAEVGQDRPTQ
ncbi:uncharacterized protein F5Z01DRAFT_357730 [Emericellopsis atlantica]|uniref:RecQ-mediated genome instability protein 1 n=1 Tax=Emericellopsis atlantica TaxID=2614577 RepID=A0A9P7ZEJ5_9HYPO|nr:uncharacterized protein F5Z01DRAFT_357730 [Emericellopsis atlantica]KAG9250540.1 hypothetical protein F5Z01DRAFT_357730 [Emericellopsis atlantica]